MSEAKERPAAHAIGTGLHSAPRPPRAWALSEQRTGTPHCADGPTNAALVGLALCAQGVAYLLYGMIERDRYWRAGALASSGVSLVVGLAVWVSARARRLRWLVAVAVLAGLPVLARIRLQSPRKVRRRR